MSSVRGGSCVAARFLASGAWTCSRGGVAAAPSRPPSSPSRPTDRRLHRAGRLRVLVVTESFLPQVNGVTNSVRRVLEHLAAEGHEAELVAPTGPATYAGFPVTLARGASLPFYADFRIGLETRRRLRATMERFRPRRRAHRLARRARPAGGAGGALARHPDGRDLPDRPGRFRRAVRRPRRRAGDGGADPPDPPRRRPHAGALHREHRAARPARRARGRPLAPRRGPGAVRTATRRDEALHAELAPRRRAPRRVRRPAGRRRRSWSCWPTSTGSRACVSCSSAAGPRRPGCSALLPDAAFLGVLHGEELARAHATLDVFVHTGRHETYCQSAQEALASGVPVVAPRSGGPIDVVARRRRRPPLRAR